MRAVPLLLSCLLMSVTVAADDNKPSLSKFPSLIGKGAQAIGSGAKGAAGAFGQELQKDVHAVKDPLDKTITYIGSSQCQNVQKIFGVSYDQVAGEKEPDLDSLTLHYKTKFFNTIMNITHAPESLRQARKFDQDQSLVLYFHGFTDDPSKSSFSTLSEAYLDKDRVSVMALDASSLIQWFYIRAATFVRLIGRKLGEVLATLYKQGQNPNKIHIVGHSLGAHIAAFTCKEFTRLTGRRVGRLTGLDPAGPCFSHVDPELRLKRTDAQYVDAIHTDAGVYGLRDPVGHKDYYPNSGSSQPNCVLQTCSHSRAWELYAESVRSPGAFPAVRCRDWDAFKKGDCEWDKISYMGYPSTPGDDGLYLLQTGQAAPYGLGMNGTKYTNTNGIVENIADLAG